MARLDELREELEKLRGKKLMLEALLKSPAWEMVDEALIANVRARRQMEFSDPIESLDAAFRSAGAKGEIAGVQAARLMPQSLLEDVLHDLEVINTEFEEEERDE